MKIETKYNIGDLVSYIQLNKKTLESSTAQGRIIAIRVFYDDIASFVRYDVETDKEPREEVYQQQIIRKV